MCDVPETVLIDVEVCVQNLKCQLPEVEEAVEEYLNIQEELVLNKSISSTIFPSDVRYVRFCSNSKSKLNLNRVTLKKSYHMYTSWSIGPEDDIVYQQNEELPASVIWCLPNEQFEGLWENLILEENVKERLITYVQTTLMYSSKQVNSQIVHWNGVLLLHGLPGSGKTTLCKALAQKLSIRLGPTYDTCKLVEINSHSLFSKWFSESPKLVLRMFDRIRQWLYEKDHFVCVLIDEVESLTQVRNAKGSEPSDSIRVVNAVLTQIDQLQRFPNFLILCTSNVPQIIDNAFADRADLKLHLSYPSELAAYEIYTSCIEELINCNLVRGNVNDFFETETYRKMRFDLTDDNDEVVSEIVQNTLLLSEVSKNSYKFSGRTIRKFPFLTSSKFLGGEIPTVREFLQALVDVINTHASDLALYKRHNF